MIPYFGPKLVDSFQCHSGDMKKVEKCQHCHQMNKNLPRELMTWGSEVMVMDDIAHMNRLRWLPGRFFVAIGGYLLVQLLWN